MNFDALFTLLLEIFLLMGLGFFLRRKNVLTTGGKKVLNDLIINVILPCNIVNSFCIELTAEVLRSCIQVLIVSILIQVFCAVLAQVLYRSVPQQRRAVLQYGTAVSNAGFLGNPVAEGLYGSMGLLYASIYLIPQRIVMWSAGISYFTESPSHREVVRKVLHHPCIIAVAIGIFLMLTQLPLPEFLTKSLSAVGGCTTAMTMLMIGAILAEAGLHNLVSRATVLYSVLRLIVIPAAVFAGCRLCEVESLAAGVSTVLAAMPAGATTAILAGKYNADEVFASQCVVLSTVLSMALLPVWCILLNMAF